ncbi:WGR domain-containing protein [Novosphingobium sp. P6W]|uniref:WGR domain-containing protein n=1 Tax=Novosphingobium sp. P6W TaxID=1609758 RepID=UPI0035144FB2
MSNLTSMATMLALTAIPNIELPAYGEILELWAVDPSRNISRTWRICKRRDLFGWTVVEWGWGRIGSRGQSRTVVFEQPEKAVALVRRLLLRRANAERRIGVAYRRCD